MLLTDNWGMAFQIDRRGPIQVMTLDRPHTRNAIDLDLSQAVAEAVDSAERDPSVRALILTGAGGTFCSGMDLKAFSRGERPTIPGRGLCGITRRAPRLPLIVAVEGAAVGGGFELVLAADLVVAGQGARFSMPEVRRGLVATQGGALRLPRRLPPSVAAEMLLTGRSVTAREMLGHGLVNRVSPDGEALDAACQLAREVAAGAPLAVDAALAVLRALSAPSPEAWSKQDQRFAPVLSSADAREGALAFAQKRKTYWEGR